MSAEDHDDNDPLQSLIAEILETENRGETVDREALLDAHPELADSLHEFFANHDRMKSAAEIDPPTLPPSSNESPLDDPTIPPKSETQEEATVPPTEPVSPDSDVVPTVGDQVRYFGDYELLEEIARGGMGVVFKARQMNLNRVVALKMILAGQFAGEEDVQRFYTEAEAAAALDHPGIVPIFEIGEHAGQHYFSMGYVEGESLAQRVAEGPLPPREAAELVKKVCNAMAYAHEHGVIHRDLKPANILLDQNGEPRVTDFGLAKRTEADSDLTGTGQILGTPAYMPPEQASGNTDEVGPLADVYSLGAVLYCLLTGRPPFQAASPMDTLLQVLDQEPVAPRAFNLKVPQDLETICLKCLGKEPKNRYASAGHISDELLRFLECQPIKARPVGKLERGWRWCKRNPTIATLTSLAATFLIVGSVVSTYFALAAIQAKGIAEEREAEAVLQQAVADRERDEAGRQAALAERRLYANQIKSAYSEWDNGNLSQATRILDATDPKYRAWEFGFLSRLVDSADLVWDKQNAITTIAVSNDESTICVAYRGDNRRDRTKNFYIDIVHSDTKATVCRLDMTGPVSVTALSPDGKRVAAVAGRDLTLWDTEAGAHLWTQEGDKSGNPNSGRIVGLEFGSDGKQVLVWREGGEPALLDARSGNVKSFLDSPSLSLMCACFTADGTGIIGSFEDGRVAEWFASSGKKLREFETRDDRVQSVATSRDGRRIATGGNDKIIRICDYADGAVLRSIVGHEGPIDIVRFLGDGERVLSASNSDGTARVWNTDTGEQLTVFKARKGFVEFRGSDKFAYGFDGYALRRWDLSVSVPSLSLPDVRDRDTIYTLAISSDGLRIAAKVSDGDIKVWDNSGSLRDRIDEPGTALAFSKDASQLFIARKGGISIRDLGSGTERPFAPSTDAYRCLSISPSGKILASAGGATISLWNTKSGKLIRSFVVPSDRRDWMQLAWSADERLIALNGCIWDAQSGQLLRVVDSTGPVAFSPDQMQFVSGSTVYDAENGRPQFKLDGGGFRIASVGFSPDGRRIVTAGRSVNIWDRAGNEILALDTPSAETGFDPSGGYIYTAGRYGTIDLWVARKAGHAFELSAATSSTAVANQATKSDTRQRASLQSTARRNGVLVFAENPLDRDLLESLDADVELQIGNSPLDSQDDLRGVELVILVDSARSSWTDSQIALLAQHLRETGCGLVFLGGKNSFRPGGWKGTSIEQRLPMESLPGLDLLPYESSDGNGMVAKSTGSHPITAGIKIPQAPITSVGTTTARAGKNVQVLLTASNQRGREFPLLAIIEDEAGRVAMFASDIGQHWTVAWLEDPHRGHFETLLGRVVDWARRKM